MTPKEKAQELVDRFDNINVLGEYHNGYIAKQCALIAVDEIRQIPIKISNFEQAVFWKEVKQEIEKL